MSAYVGRHRLDSDDGRYSIAALFGYVVIFGEFGPCKVTPTPKDFPGRHATARDAGLAIANAAIQEMARIVRDDLADMPPLDLSQGPPRRRRRWFE